ncbi:MAG: efflux RND transporter periplasmic adaptor subunit [Leptospirillia bacterium]
MIRKSPKGSSLILLGLALVGGLFFPPSLRAEEEKVRIPPDVIRTLGITDEVLSPGRGHRVIRSNGEVDLIDDRVRYVTARSIHRLSIFGYVHNIYVDTGDKVLSGQVLMTAFAPDYIEAQQEYLQAIRLEKITEKAQGKHSLSPKIREAALARLKNLGVVDREIRRLEATRVIRRYLKIRSPLTGYVLKKNVIDGQSINSGDRLFVIGNLDWVRVNARVYEQDLPSLSIGEVMRIRPPKSTETLVGHIEYISPLADPRTRTVIVRGIFRNTPLILRPGMYLPVRIIVPSRGNTLWVPKSAVFLSGGHRVVFVREGVDRFLLRNVTVGSSEEGLVPVLSGLRPGERIVIHNGFWVKAQFERKKSS